MKNSKALSAGVILAVVIGGGVWAVVLRNKNGSNTNQTASTNFQQQSSVETAKTATEKDFEKYVGEDYDRMFLSNMIEHHQGAIDMANLALSNAKHQELKNLAQNIVKTQSKESKDMKAWQKTWGYPTNSGEEMMNHSSMSMATSMDLMTESLRGKTGDEFDKAFLGAMIEHHESAVAMSRPGVNNAAHQEIKELTKAIIEAQNAEIAQMRDWLGDWGYEG
ncbi:DUF305 domain-containing protein [Candidatus Saccharibacteria bacterium]|nr:DUF305 domain-containing protein [Candidatus Saccharibacteria bacterium]